ncbi:hypothetical protein BZG36_00441 [Bifiguratus adelaidae]|uniref:Bacterial transcription activator effector binding domain-containing protein n=1 Tax=Bifiguratus adelaidae TaxID=1938954 RepID=A0A261Y7W3_9FUNG|nr:hypothetical protein BZG36_00441 [Bifiguratus adelaidae]
MSYQVVDIPERRFLVNEVIIKEHNGWKPITEAAFAYLKQFAEEAGVTLKNESKLYPDDPTDPGVPEIRFWPGYRLSDDADLEAIRSKIASAQVQPSHELAKVDFKVVTLPKQKCAVRFHDEKTDIVQKSWGGLFEALHADKDWVMDDEQHIVYSMVRDGDQPEVGYDIVVPLVPKH